jgi:hypothetical protein
LRAPPRDREVLPPLKFHHKHAAATAESHTPLVGSEILASEIASGSAAIQALAGLAAIVLGILAVAGMDVTVLTLVALLALGATLVMSGSTLSGTVMSLMRPSTKT